VSLAKVSELREVSGWWRRSTGSLLHITHYVSESGRRYPRESVGVTLYLPDGSDHGLHATPVEDVRKLLVLMGYAKVGEEYERKPKVAP
jgi:hypothetical protein